MKISTSALVFSIFEHLAFTPRPTYALSLADLATVFGQDATALTGSSVALPQFELSVVLNATYALFCLNATNSKPYQVGWMGSGIGSAMANADFLITWPNAALANGQASSTPWTLSHRATSNGGVAGEAQPVLASTYSASSTSALFTYVPQLSTTDPASPFTVVAYLRPLTFASDLSASQFKPLQPVSTEFIYASSSVQPDNTAENAVLTQHDQAHATTTLDLSTRISLSASTGTSSSSSSSSGTTPSSAPLKSSKQGTSKRDMYLIAHGVLGALAIVLFTPVAILNGRYFRSYSGWFPIHAGVQLLAVALLIAGCSLGFNYTPARHFFDAHTRLGLALLILVILQVTLGAVSHRVPAPKREDVRHARFPTLSRKSPVRILHICLGIAITVAGFTQVRLGFREFRMYSDGQTHVPHGVVIVFWVLAALVAVLYLGGWVLEGFKPNNSIPHGKEGVEKVSSTED